jgi:hypothetical protein
LWFEGCAKKPTKEAIRPKIIFTNEPNLHQTSFKNKNWQNFSESGAAQIIDMMG